MAKKLASELTPQELAAKHEKAKERRVARKENDLQAITEIVALIKPEQMKALSENAQRLIKRLQQEYKPASSYDDVVEGADITQLFLKHPNMSFKKLTKRCEENGWKIEGTKIVKA